MPYTGSTNPPSKERDMNKTAVRYIGLTDDVLECAQCGKPDLRATVVLEILDEENNGSGEVTYYGTTCAARALGARGVRTTAAKIRSAAEVAHRDTVRRAVDSLKAINYYGLPEQGHDEEALLAALPSFTQRNPGLSYRSPEWYDKALRECLTDWQQRVAEARLLGWTPAEA